MKYLSDADEAKRIDSISSDVYGSARDTYGACRL